MRVGLYFGSFNPVHIGHLIIANHIAQNTSLDQVWFIVSPQNPLKTSQSLLNEYQRLHLVRLAIEDNDLLRASDIEFGLTRPSYTIDTLTYLAEKYPQHTFSILMGSDSYQNLHKWKNGELIKNQYSLFVYERPGFDLPIKSAELVAPPLLAISATMIRNTIKKKQSIRYLVPDKVAEEILRCGYYK